MDPNEIRDIMQMTGKLESTFRHIRYLCGRYLQIQHGVNPYHQPYGQFEMGYPPISTFSHESFYPPYSNGYAPQPQPPSTKINNTQKSPLKIKPSEIPTKPSSKVSSDRIQPTKKQKQSLSQKQPKHISTESKQPKTSSKTQNIVQPSTVSRSAFEIFLNRKGQQIKKQYPHLDRKQLYEIMEDVWQSFSQAERDPYEAEVRKMKAEEKKDKKEEIIKNGNKAMTASDIAKSLKMQLSK